MPALQRFFALCLLVFGLGSALFAQQSGVQPANQVRMFALNLWNSTLDIKYGTEGLFSTAGLSPHSLSQIVTLGQVVPRSLFIRSDANAAWQEGKKADGSSLVYNIRDGATYMILIQENGTTGLYELHADQGESAKLSVFNATGKDLAMLRVGAAVDHDVEISGDGLGKGWTDFAAVAPGTYSIFWSYASMPDGVDYFFVPGRDGASLGKSALAASAWYVLLLGMDAKSGVSTGVLWDISPVSK